MSTFWTAIILVPVALTLIFSGLFIVLILVVAVVGGIEGIDKALVHRFGSHGALRHRHYGAPAASH
jgi:hypothetical protein